MTDRPTSPRWRGPIVVAGVLGWVVCLLWYLLVSDTEPWGPGTFAWLPLLGLSLPGLVAATLGSAKLLRDDPPGTQDEAWAYATPVTLACAVLAIQCALALSDGRLLSVFSGAVMCMGIGGVVAMVWAVAPAGRSEPAAPDDVDDGPGPV